MAFVIPAIGAAISSISTAAATIPAVVGPSLTAAGVASTALPAGIAATAPGWFTAANIGLASTAIGGVTGAYGAIKTGQAEASAAKYSSDLNALNARVAENNKDIASQSGAQQTAMQEQKNRARMGEIKSQQAASGLDVNSGSAVDVRSSAAELGQLDALTVRSNATREAYGYQAQEDSFKQQGYLDQFEAKDASRSGIINAGTTLLGAAGNASSNWGKYRDQGGLTL